MIRCTRPANTRKPRLRPYHARVYLVRLHFEHLKRVAGEIGAFYERVKAEAAASRKGGMN